MKLVRSLLALVLLTALPFVAVAQPTHPGPGDPDGEYTHPTPRITGQSGGGQYSADWDGTLDAAHAVAAKLCPSPYGQPCFTTIQAAIDDVEARAPGNAVRTVYVAGYGRFFEDVAWTETSGESHLICVPPHTTWDTEIQIPAIHGLTDGNDNYTVKTTAGGSIKGCTIYAGADEADGAYEKSSGGFMQVEDNFMFASFSEQDLADGCLIHIADGNSSSSTFRRLVTTSLTVSDQDDNGASGATVCISETTQFYFTEFVDSQLEINCDGGAGNCGDGNDSPAVFKWLTGGNAPVTVRGSSLINIGDFGGTAGQGSVLVEAPGNGRHLELRGPGVHLEARNGIPNLLNITSSPGDQRVRFTAGVFVDWTGFNGIGTTNGLTFNLGAQGIIKLQYDADAAPPSFFCENESAGSTAHNLDETHASQLYVCEGATAGWVAK